MLTKQTQSALRNRPSPIYNMGPLVLIASLLLIVNSHISTITYGYELGCGYAFRTLSTQLSCTLRNATQYDLDSFGVAGIPEGSPLEVLSPEFEKFDDIAFWVMKKAHHLTFSRGIVKSIVFQSSTLVSLKVMDSWIERFIVLEENNFSLKTLTIRSVRFRTISHTIRYLKGLEEITFRECNLEFIDFNQLAELENLRLLDLSWNQIHYVKISQVMPLMALESLDVSQNHLTEIQNFPFGFPSLKTVSLMWNAWYCDWVSEARGRIWTTGIMVLGAENICINRRNARMANNGGLCCRER